MKSGAEMVLEVSEACLDNVCVDGSLLVRVCLSVLQCLGKIHFSFIIASSLSAWARTISLSLLCTN